MDGRLKEWAHSHKWLPEYAGFTTKNLAAYLGVSTRTIQRWMKDIGQPSEAQLSRIEQFILEEAKDNRL